MSIIDLGEFKIDIQERRLYRNQEEISVEPKVIELLCYLIQHNDRFVSLKELHQEIWKDRVVTDTAVRRTVSKLRNLLGDQDIEHPKYIRSQMKRGYQLIYPLHKVVQANNSKNLSSVIETKTKSSWVLFNTFNIKFINISILLLLLIFITFALVNAEVNFQRNNQQIILDIPGQKASLAVSSDGRYQTFVGRISNRENWQLFLHDTVNGELTKILSPVPHVRFVDFVSSDSLLAYVGFRNDKAELYLQSVADLSVKPEQISLPNLPILAGPLALPNNQILVAGGQAYNGNIHYYQYDLKTKSFNQFSYSGVAGVQDAYATLSPDQQKIALIRANLAEKKLYFQLYNLKTKELIFEQLISKKLVDIRLAWLNNLEILIKYSDNFKKLNIEQQQISDLRADASNIKEIVLRENNQYFAIYKKQAESQLYKTSWPYKEGFNQHLQLGDQVTSLMFSQEGAFYWLVEQVDTHYILSKYYPATAERELVMQSETEFSIIDQAKNTSLLLLKRKNRLEIFNYISGLTSHISLGAQLIDQGVFNSGATAVYFAVLSAGQWQVMCYQIDDRSVEVLISDYRFLKPYQNGYLAANESGELWLLDSTFKRDVRLYEGLHFDLDYKILLHDDEVNIAHKTLMSDWELVQINLKTEQIWQRKLTNDEFTSHFSINNKGNELLFIKPKHNKNQVVSGGYSLGYSLVL